MTYILVNPNSGYTEEHDTLAAAVAAGLTYDGFTYSVREDEETPGRWGLFTSSASRNGTMYRGEADTGVSVAAAGEAEAHDALMLAWHERHPRAPHMRYDYIEIWPAAEWARFLEDAA